MAIIIMDLCKLCWFFFLISFFLPSHTLEKNLFTAGSRASWALQVHWLRYSRSTGRLNTVNQQSRGHTTAWWGLISSHLHRGNFLFLWAVLTFAFVMKKQQNLYIGDTHLSSTVAACVFVCVSDVRSVTSPSYHMRLHIMTLPVPHSLMCHR